MEDKKDLQVENQQFGPNKQKFRDNFAAAYPDVDMNDEEAYFGALNDRNDQYDRDKARLDELEGAQVKFGEALDSDPRLAELFLEMTKDGGKPIEYLINHYAQAFSDLVNDPDNPEYRDALAKKLVEDVAAEKDRQQMESEAAENIGPSLDALSKVASERGLSDEQVSETFEKFVSFTKDLIVDKVSEEMWKVFVDGLNHDADVEQAFSEGETKGRNSRISEKLRSEKPNPMNMGTSATVSSGGQRPQRSLGRSVWDED